MTWYHEYLGVPRRWPSVTAAARTVLHWRLRALPYTYTVHHTAHATGCPIARPLFFAFPADGDSSAASTQVHMQILGFRNGIDLEP